MITIEYGNVTCRVNGLTDLETDLQIAEKLSYDGKSLYSIKTHTTYTGLLPYIVQILRRRGLQFQLVDRRVRPTPDMQLALAEGITPRDYQQAVLDKVGGRDGGPGASRIVVQAATGAGKTLILAGAIAEFKVKSIIISKNSTLAYQLRDEIQRFLGRPVGVLTGNTRDVKDVTVATPQMALKSDLLKQAKAILIDECQFLGSRTMFAVCRAAVNAYFRVAVSATPWRDGNDDLLIEAAVNVRNPRTNINATTLIRKGKLTKAVINFLKIPAVPAADAARTYGEQYAKAISENTYRNDRVLEIIKHSRRLNHGSVLVLFQQVKHGRHLLERIRREVGNVKRTVVVDGVAHEVNSVELISGETSMEERNVILQAAREEKVEVLLGSTIADEGLDCPALKVLILAGGGKSSTRAFQRVGRVLRLFKGRETAHVWDMLDETPIFHNHYLYRRALYETEPEWVRNIHVVNSVAEGAVEALTPMKVA